MLTHYCNMPMMQTILVLSKQYNSMERSNMSRTHLKLNRTSNIILIDRTRTYHDQQSIFERADNIVITSINFHFQESWYVSALHVVTFFPFLAYTGQYAASMYTLSATYSDIVLSICLSAVNCLPSIYQPIHPHDALPALMGRAADVQSNNIERRRHNFSDIVRVELRDPAVRSRVHHSKPIRLLNAVWVAAFLCFIRRTQC